MNKVIDTNVLIHGRGSRFQEGLTVPEVLDEVRSRSAERSREITDLRVEEPDNSALEKVKNLSDEINSPTSLTDEKLVALALDKEAKLISDDKAVQNLAKHLEVSFDSFLEDRIKEKKSWRYICPSCGSETEKRCSTCGRDPILRQV